VPDPFALFANGWENDEPQPALLETSFEKDSKVLDKMMTPPPILSNPALVGLLKPPRRNKKLDAFQSRKPEFPQSTRTRSTDCIHHRRNENRHFRLWNCGPAPRLNPLRRVGLRFHKPDAASPASSVNTSSQAPLITSGNRMQ
jgi:hypothetical protein